MWDVGCNFNRRKDIYKKHGQKRKHNILSESEMKEKIIIFLWSVANAQYTDSQHII